MKKLQKKIIVITLLCSLFFPILSSAQTKIELPHAELPETFEEALEEGQEVGGQIAGKLPETVKNIWDTRVIPIWTKMFDWAKKVLWEKYTAPFLSNIWNQFTTFSEEKRPQLEEEFAKEKQEIKEGLQSAASKAGKGLWQRFFDLFRDENEDN